MDIEVVFKGKSILNSLKLYHHGVGETNTSRKERKKEKTLDPFSFAISNEATSSSPTRVSIGRPINVELEETRRMGFQTIRLMV